MIDKKIEQLKMLKDITLSEKERGILRTKIARSIQTLESTPKISYFYSGVSHGLRIGLSTFLFIVFVGGSVSVVADNSLPGDPLYSFKINVNEEVKGAFIKSPADKLSYQTTLIDNRLTEIKTLAASKTLTKAKQETAQKALDTHIESLSKQLSTLSDAKPAEALKVTATLEESLKVQKEDLEKIIVKENSDTTDTALKAVDDTIKKVSAQEVKIISKEIDQLVLDIKEVPETKVTGETEVKSTTEVKAPALPSSPLR
ncbi:MAG: hypothetical protein KBC11_01565 [Candidatus Pacebacteria bacterium]|nr:hypothetical protein [Candidatus Paceibacterota bacterium]